MKIFAINKFATENIAVPKTNNKNNKNEKENCCSDETKNATYSTLPNQYYSNNINFKQVSMPRQISLPEYKALLTDIMTKANKLGIHTMDKKIESLRKTISDKELEHYYNDDSFFYGDIKNAEVYLMQTLNTLLTHPIIKVDNVRKNIRSIVDSTAGKYAEEERLAGEALLKFADFLLSPEAKPLMEHPSMKEKAYKVFTADCRKDDYLSDRSDSLAKRLQFARTLLSHPEALNDINFDVAQYLHLITA